MKKLLTVVGKTTDGRPVVSGAFFLCDTHGIPLSDMIVLLRKKGMVIAWDHFISEANAAGWKSVDAKIHAAILEAA